jgi:small-conductance mechanosensitive channel
MTIPEKLIDQLTPTLTDTVVPIVLIVVIALVLLKLARIAVNGVVRALLDREAAEGTTGELSAVEIQKRTDTLVGLGTTVIRIFIVAIAGLMILGELNLNIGPAIAGLGVVGIAVGFGTQSIVRDYFTGALILVENQFSKGDFVSIAGVSGTVEDFSLRRTTLRDVDGAVHSVPNGEIKVASNMTRVWARINQDISVAYGTDLEKAIAVIDDVGREMYADPQWRRRVMEAPHVARVGQLGEYGVALRVQGMVRASEQWAAAGELRKRILVAFAAHGIEIPHPQRVVLARDPIPGAGDGGPTDDDLSDGLD